MAVEYKTVNKYMNWPKYWHIRNCESGIAAVRINAVLKALADAYSSLMQSTLVNFRTGRVFRPSVTNRAYMRSVIPYILLSGMEIRFEECVVIFCVCCYTNFILHSNMINLRSYFSQQYFSIFCTSKTKKEFFFRVPVVLYPGPVFHYTCR